LILAAFSNCNNWTDQMSELNNRKRLKRNDALECASEEPHT